MRRGIEYVFHDLADRKKRLMRVIIGLFILALLFGLIATLKYRSKPPAQHQSHGFVQVAPPPLLNTIKPESKAKRSAAAEKNAKSKVPLVRGKSRKAKRPTSGHLVAAAKPQRKEFRWEHWGAAPYARSLREACEKSSTAIDGMSMPEAVKEHFKKALGDCEGGTIVWLTPNERLEQMWSGPDKGHPKDRIMNGVTVAELPVLKSPHGRPYRKGTVAETAKALEWSYVYEGETYFFDIPLVCFNESWRIGPAPSSLQEKCVELSFDAPVGGEVRWGVGSTEGPLPPSVCNAQRQGNLAWTAWLGECDLCIPALGYIRSILGGSAMVPHKYKYPVIERRQTLRFSTAIWSRVVYICLQYPDGTQSCGVYMRPQDWKGRRHVAISDSLWLKDDGNCPR